MRNGVTIGDHTLIGAGALIMKNTRAAIGLRGRPHRQVRQDQRPGGSVADGLGQAGADHRAARSGAVGRHPRGAAGRARDATAATASTSARVMPRNRAHIGYADLSLDAGAPPPVVQRRRPCCRPARSARSTTPASRVSCLVAHDEPAVPLLHGLGARGERAVLPARGPGRERRRRPDVPPRGRRRRCSTASPSTRILTASPWVLVDNGVWRMWYVSGTAWDDGADGPRHRYHIKYAESRDGAALAAARRGVHRLRRRPTNTRSAVRASSRTASGYRMWYSFRGTAYRLGYAESPDGLVWTRRDDEHVLPASAERLGLGDGRVSGGHRRRRTAA